MSQPAKKTVLITGCSPGGIGHALALEFHSKGFHVIASARNKNVLSDLEEKGMSTLSLDVTKENSISEAKIEVEELTGGRLDVLVNNAGANCTLPALEVSLSDVSTCFETNLFSVIALTQSLTPLLLPTKGLIINIGSVAAIVPYVFGAVYNASKAALHAYSNTLRLELEPFGVDVLVVVTGGVKSRIARTERKLGEGSLYAEIEGGFERRVRHSQEGAMDARVYAEGVVREALKVRAWGVGWWGCGVLGGGRRKWLWRGNRAGEIWWVWNFLGGWVFDLVLPRMFGLRKLRRIVEGRERKGS